MHKSIYYYYDKILITNCKLEKIYAYAGKVPRDAVLQLMVYPLETEKIPLSTPAGISAAGDFYLAALPGGTSYRIHRNGKLIRAYIPEPAMPEDTMSIPMAVLAHMQDKALINGSAMLGKNSVYAFIGETEEVKACGFLRDDTMLISRAEDGYTGTPASFPCYDASRDIDFPLPLALKGIVVLQRGGWRATIAPIVSPELKKSLLLKNLTGFNLFSQELRQSVTDSKIINDASRDIPMNTLTLPKHYEKWRRGRKRILKLVEKRPK